MDNTVFFTSSEVAKRYRIKESTVRRWIQNGQMPALDLSIGGRPGPYRISAEHLREFEAGLIQKSSGGERRGGSTQ